MIQTLCSVLMVISAIIFLVQFFASFKRSEWYEDDGLMVFGEKPDDHENP
jgi:hypothetical protein